MKSEPIPLELYLAGSQHPLKQLKNHPLYMINVLDFQVELIISSSVFPYICSKIIIEQLLFGGSLVNAGIR